MRPLASLAVLASLSAAACEEGGGAYITVVSDTPFARLDYGFGFYAQFGPDQIVPRHPAETISSTDPPYLPGLMFARQVAEQDDVRLAPPARTHTYRLPATKENAELGDYLLVRAFDESGALVGLGELANFEIPDDAAYLYEVKLESPQAARYYDTWGRESPDDCIRYDKDRGGDVHDRIALVRDGDIDCDKFPDYEVDCEPHVYCDPATTGACTSSTPCISDAETCVASATCTNSDTQPYKRCESSVCIAARSCESCNLSAPPREVLACALASPEAHPESDIGVPMMTGDLLCDDAAVRIALVNDSGESVLCLDPAILAIASPPGAEDYDDTIQFAVRQEGSTCLFTFTPSDASQRNFTGIPHLLVAIGEAANRVAFVIGFLNNGPAGCGTQTISYQVAIGTCEPE